MQIKKHDENLISKESAEPPNSLFMKEEIGQKKIILWGIGAGVVVAALAGSWLWHSYGPHLLGLIEKTGKNHPANSIAKLKPSENSSLAVNSHSQIQPSPPIQSHFEGENLSEIPPAPINPQAKNLTEQNTVPTVPNKNIENQKLSEFQTEALIKSSTEKSVQSNISRVTSENYHYNALSSGPIISASPRAEIEVSRDVSFKKLYVRGTTDKLGGFRITPPPPGVVYWRIKGSNVANQIIISAAEPINIEIKLPDTLNLGDTFSWGGSANASYYKVEVASDASFSGSVKTFSTKENLMNTNLIGGGTWFMRVSALNLQSGTFDYSNIVQLRIQQPQAAEQSQEPLDEAQPLENSLSGAQKEALEVPLSYDYYPYY